MEALQYLAMSIQLMAERRGKLERIVAELQIPW
jgi:hypothetical protein